jgi:LPXTG-motif cell wall-anchored protein
MEIDAELRRQIAVSLAAAAVFVAGLVGIGVTFGGSSELPETGAIALVALLAAFVLLMALVGAYLIRANDDDDA